MNSRNKISFFVTIVFIYTLSVFTFLAIGDFIIIKFLIKFRPYMELIVYFISFISGYYFGTATINKMKQIKVDKTIIFSGYILGCLLALVPFSFYFSFIFLRYAFSMKAWVYITFILSLLVIKFVSDKYFLVAKLSLRILIFITPISLVLLVVININRIGIIEEVRINSWKPSSNDLYLNNNLLLKTRDEGFIIGVNNLNNDMIKFDNEGNEEWSKEIFEERHTHPFAITTTNDNGFIVLSKNNYFNSIVKIDSQGKIQWEKDYSDAKIIDVTNLVKAKNDYYFGYTKDSLLTFVELNENGQETNTMYTSIKLSYNPDILILDSSGSFIVATTKYRNNNITKISKYGKILHNKTVDMEYITSIYKTDNDNYIVTGSEMTVAKLDKDLNSIWIKEYGSGDDVAMSVQKIENSKYIIVGRDAKAIWMDPVTTYGWLIKIDEEGNLISSEIFGNGRLYEFNYLNQVILTEDNNLIVTGYKNSGKTFWILKLDSEHCP